MSKFVLWGSETDGPFLQEYPDDVADAVATDHAGHVFDTRDDALDAWEGRGTPALGPGTPDTTDAPAPAGDAPTPAPVGDPLDAPSAPSTQAPSESSPTADQS